MNEISCSLDTEAVAEPAARAAHVPDAASLALRVRELAPLPQALVEALRVLRRDGASAASCVSAIERDPALSVRVLRLANSGFYGASKRIASIGDAVKLLGLRTVAAVLAAASLRGALGSMPEGGLSPDHYWRHSLGTAVAARELAPELGLDPDEAFIAGLLHDIGRWMMALFHPRETARAMAWARDNGADCQSGERRFLGVTHDELGAQVARHWNFPPATLHAIAAHHTPLAAGPGERAGLDLLIQAADAVAQSLDICADPHEPAAPLDAGQWPALQLDEAALSRLAGRIEQYIQAMAGL